MNIHIVSFIINKFTRFDGFGLGRPSSTTSSRWCNSNLGLRRSSLLGGHCERTKGESCEGEREVAAIPALWIIQVALAPAPRKTENR